jgi:hypothetical protein
MREMAGSQQNERIGGKLYIGEVDDEQIGVQWHGFLYISWPGQELHKAFSEMVSSF